jgi:LPS-assembly protein
MHYHRTSLLAYFSVKSASAILTVLLFHPVLALSDKKQESAAEQDWIPRQYQSDSTVPWHCDGRYEAPPSFRTSASKTQDTIIVATDDALHVEDHSTTFNGRVQVDGQGRRINAAHITVDSVSEIATAHGPVSIREPGLLLKGDRASGNLFAGTGVMDNTTFLLHQNRMRGKARKIVKKGDDTLEITDGTFTRCDPGSNLWAFEGKHIELKRTQGYGVARNATVRIKGVPIAYFPYIRFPLNDERYSGFLMPGLGHDSEGGTDIDVSYYLNLAPNYDTTYTLRSLWKRGLIHDLEARYLNELSSNFIDMAYLRGDDKLEESLGTQTDRWLLYFNHVGLWTSRWRSAISFGALSDVDYLRDIGGDIDASTQETYRNFRSLGTNIPALTRIGTLRYQGRGWSASLLARGYQSLNRNAARQYSALPQFTLRLNEKLSLFDFTLRGQLSRFDKDNDGLTGPLAIIGNRVVVDTKVSTSFRNAWGYVRPQAGAIYRKYSLDDVPIGTPTSPSLTTPFASLDTGVVFDRFFSYRGSELLQTLEPRLYFLYVNEDAQRDLPQFDAAASTPGFSTMFRWNRFSGYDRIGDAQQISVGLTSAVLNANSGAELVKASIGQIVYLADREVIFRPGRLDDPQAGSSPLFTQARFRIGRFSLSGSYEWEPRDSRSNRGRLSLKYRDATNRRILNFNYSYTNPDVQKPSRSQNAEETDLSFIWPLKGKWSVIGRWNFGWDNNQTIESLLGVEYNDCCWKTRLAFRRFQEQPRTVRLVVDDPASGTKVVSALQYRADTGIFFEFQLKGLSTLGKRLDTLLEDSIPGYRRRENQIDL